MSDAVVPPPSPAEFFPEWTSGPAAAGLAALPKLLQEWNERLNLLSNNELPFVVERHLFPSLMLGQRAGFAPGTRVLDAGTGGGFPGLPLAICFPEVQFLLVDSIGKKVRAVEAIAKELGLKNVATRQARVETLPGGYDFVTGRAVAALPTFVGWVAHLIRPGKRSALANGILYLKGGDCTEELQQVGASEGCLTPLGPLFGGRYCEDKCLIHLPAEILPKTERVVIPEAKTNRNMKRGKPFERRNYGRR